MGISLTLITLHFHLLLKAINTDLKLSIAKKLKRENIYLYWKDRVALYAIFKSIGVGKGDEVILPAYTCIAI